MTWFEVKDIAAFGISAASLIIFYLITRTLHNRYHVKLNTIDRKEVLKGRSWLLSLAAAIVLTIEGVMQCIELAAKNNGTWGGLVDLTNRDDPVTGSRELTIFFMVFCALDLIIGLIDYRSQLAILTGWVHHTVYISMLTWFCAVRTTVSFTIFGILELPTAVLAVGSIYKPWRMDMTFGITFLSTRILYMGAIWVLACIYSTPFRIFVITAMMCLHLYWFYGWVMGMLKKRRRPGARRDDAGKDSDTSSTSTDSSGARGGDQNDGDQSSADSAPPSPLLNSKDGLGARDERIALMSTHRNEGGAPAGSGPVAAGASGSSSGRGSGMDPLHIGANASPLAVAVLGSLGDPVSSSSTASNGGAPAHTALTFVPPPYSASPTGSGNSPLPSPSSPPVVSRSGSSATTGTATGVSSRHSTGFGSTTGSVGSSASSGAGAVAVPINAPLSARSDASAGSRGGVPAIASGGGDGLRSRRSGSIGGSHEAGAGGGDLV